MKGKTRRIFLKELSKQYIYIYIYIVSIYYHPLSPDFITIAERYWDYRVGSIGITLGSPGILKMLLCPPLLRRMFNSVLSISLFAFPLLTPRKNAKVDYILWRNLVYFNKICHISFKAEHVQHNPTFSLFFIDCW
jgi:hypothetical protein